MTARIAANAWRVVSFPRLPLLGRRISRTLSWTDVTESRMFHLSSSLGRTRRSPYSTEASKDSNSKTETSPNEGSVKEGEPDSDTEKEKDAKQENNDTKQKKDEGNNEKVLTPEEEIKKLQEELKKKDLQLKEKHDQLLRSYAEVDNAHKIKKQELEKERLYSSQNFALSVLEVADNLKLALEAVKEQAEKESAESPFRSLFEGVQMTDKVLHQILERHHVVKLPVTGGSKFDPHHHQALFEVPSEEHHGTVHSVLKDGYKIRERVLRPAHVGVHKKKP